MHVLYACKMEYNLIFKRQGRENILISLHFSDGKKKSRFPEMLHNVLYNMQKFTRKVL